MGLFRDCHLTRAQKRQELHWSITAEVSVDETSAMPIQEVHRQSITVKKIAEDYVKNYIEEILFDVIGAGRITRGESLWLVQEYNMLEVIVSAEFDTEGEQAMFLFYLTSKGLQ